MASRFPLPLLLPALILAGCNSGSVSARQTDEAAPSNTASAAAPAAAATAACSISGWSSDPDPAGLNVRAGPSTRAAIVGRLPPPESGEDIEVDFGATFDVVESRDGWFRIRNARRWSESAQDPSTLPSGWISGRYFTFQLQSDQAFAAPDPSSAVVASAWDEGGTIMPIAYRNPVECRGEWVRLTVAGRDGRAREGWVRGICGLQETSCDGVRGDMLNDDESRGWRTMD